ncbi:MAG TPA: glycosyltransferase [Streptosporangiaceae bacterium]|nr:glycosyltransferase [Streptosporangiaceae bacterium]
MPEPAGAAARGGPAAGGAPAARAAQVVAVVVTWNRRDLLMESLAAVTAQSRPPDAVIVIDNASDDGTAQAVRARFPAVRLTGLTRNTGGAGGFAAGLALALADGADLVWLMDDDTVPRHDALAPLAAAWAGHPGQRPALVASQVVWTDGRAHPMNTPRRRPLAGRDRQRAAAAAGCVPVRSASFVSVLVDAAACRERGLPQADYFLWNDDFEFTTRLLRGRAGLLCPASLVVHKTRLRASTDTDPGPRFFYEVRNKIWMLRSAAPLSPLERVLYGGSTLRRWATTFARSGDRRALGAALARGVVAGLARRPRPAAEVLAGAGLDISVLDIAGPVSAGQDARRPAAPAAPRPPGRR